MQQIITQTIQNGHLSTDKPIEIIDVGSQDFSTHISGDVVYTLISTTYKTIFKQYPLWRYRGLDLEAGQNVDIVADKVLRPVSDNSCDLVISGQTLEHVEAPWLWIKELERICKPGGIIVVIAPWKWEIHRYPKDCWRILPDGMEYLLGQWCNCEVLTVGSFEIDPTSGDCWGVAKKR